MNIPEWSGTMPPCKYMQRQLGQSGEEQTTLIACESQLCPNSFCDIGQIT